MPEPGNRVMLAGAQKDTARLGWVESIEAHVVTHREMWGGEWAIWWRVIRGNRSISGHPQGSIRAAIDAVPIKPKLKLADLPDEEIRTFEEQDPHERKSAMAAGEQQQ